MLQTHFVNILKFPTADTSSAARHFLSVSSLCSSLSYDIDFSKQENIET